MKYTIEGFSQEVAVRLGLDSTDLVLLRWIIDFYNSGVMDIRSFNDKRFFWIQYDYLIHDMPILGLTNRTSLGRRLKRMVTAGLLEFKLVPSGGGTKTFYGFNEKCLVSLLSKHDEKPEPLDSKVKRVLTQKSSGPLLKSQVLYDPSTNDPNTNNIYITIFNLWNSQNLITHRDFNKFKSAIYGALKSYTDDEIKQAILNYGMVVNSDKYFFKWKWTLDQFLGRKNGMDRFLPGNFNENDYLKNISHSNQTKQTLISENYLNERLGRIAKKETIKEILSNTPKDKWWIVDKFLRKRYPASNGIAEAERELIAGQRKVAEIASNIGKGI